MKPVSTLLVALAGAGLTVLATTAKARSVTFDYSRTVSSQSETAQKPVVSSHLQISGAKNIYIVDGINNVVEVFDQDFLFVPTPKSLNTTLEDYENVYFVDGINNTLQVLEGNNLPTVLDQKSQTSTGNFYAIDEINQNLKISSSDTPGLISLSVKKDQIADLFSKEINLYLVDGINNSLEISEVNPSESVPIIQQTTDFFANSFSQQNSVSSDFLSLISQFNNNHNVSVGDDQTGLGDLFTSISDGAFGKLPEDTLEKNIIDSIGDQNRQSGWIKNLSFTENINFDDRKSGENGEAFSSQRRVNASTLKIEALLDIDSKNLGNTYFVDGFNNKLQVINTYSKQVKDFASVYLVDGINNSLQVSDSKSQFALFDSNGTEQKAEIDPSFLYFLANYALGNSQSLPIEAEQTFNQFGSRKFNQTNLDIKKILSSSNITDELNSSTVIESNLSEDFYQLEGINNRLEAGIANPEIDFSEGIAVDGEGNVYLVDGINNRLRVAQSTSVPDPSSLLGLILFGAGIATFGKRQE